MDLNDGIWTWMDKCTLHIMLTFIDDKLHLSGTISSGTIMYNIIGNMLILSFLNSALFFIK